MVGFLTNNHIYFRRTASFCSGKVLKGQTGKGIGRTDIKDGPEPPSGLADYVGAK